LMWLGPPEPAMHNSSFSIQARIRSSMKSVPRIRPYRS
jgi:hypothetical protein